jgi:HEAT repeat protein
LPKGCVLRDDDIEARIPGPERISPETLQTETVTDPDAAELEELKKSLDAPSMDLQLSTIILEIFTSDVSADKRDSLKENLIDSCRYFLGIGDFGALHELHGRMLEYGRKTPEADRPMQGVFSLFAQPEFIEEVLDGPRIWGKDKYPEVQNLLLSIGAPFVDPLLNHLAEEENLSIRYFFIDCLLKMGEAAREPILSRLYDGRWYFVRNLVMILRKLGNPSELPLPTSLRRLLRHPHAKVREEVLKTLLEFKDPDADRMLLNDLSGKDRAVRLNAATLAENSQSRPILDKLLEILQKGDLFGSEMDLKKRIVQTLAKIGNPEILPDLEAILETSSLIQRNALKQLKVEIIRSVEFYPGAASSALLERLSHAADGELASVARLTLRNMRRNNS